MLNSDCDCEYLAYVIFVRMVLAKKHTVVNRILHRKLHK